MNTCLVCITMLIRLFVEVDMFSVFPIMDWKKKQEDLKVLRRSPDRLNNVKIGQGQM